MIVWLKERSVVSWFQRFSHLPVPVRLSSSRRSGPQPGHTQPAASAPAHIAEELGMAFDGTGSLPEDINWDHLSTGTEEDYYWHRLADNFYQKDVLPSTYLELHNHCYEAYNANPLAFAIIELTTSFVLGEGITIAASNRRVQQLFDTFWHHPQNCMDERIYSLCTELSLYGEQFIHFFVNPYDGTVILRQIDPSLIDEIETDPEDIERPLRYHRRPIIQDILATPQALPSEHSSEKRDNLSSSAEQGTWFIANKEVIQIAINKVSNAKRGKSDLATLLIWLRRYKDWLTDRVRINKYKGAFLWDVQLRGADHKTLEHRRMELAQPPSPGTVNIHNDTETWHAIAPNINASDATADGRAIKLMIAVGATLPEHYLSDGDNNNRATAAEMALPTLLKFKRRQRVLRYMLRQILDRVILEAQKAGRLGPRVDTTYDITFPEIDSGEHNLLAQGMNWLLPALQTAKAQGWISDETAMKIMFEYCGEEVDIHEELARISSQMKGSSHASGRK